MSLIGTNNEEKIWNYLKGIGLSDAGTAGLMGNLYAESGLIPNNLQNTYEKKLGLSDAEYTKRVDSGAYANFVRDSAGYGLAQWTYWSRKQGLLDFAKSRGTSIADLETQLGFLAKELSGYSSLLSLLKSANSVKEASDAVLTQFERPADQSSSVKTKRAGYGQAYFDKYAKKAVVSAKKEVSALKLVQAILTKNPCYTSGKKITVKGLMLHSVGCPQPSANAFVKNWNSASYDRACVHGFIDANDGTVYQTLPWNHRGWHAGGSANNTHIGVEMCEPACIKYTSGASFTCSDKSAALAAVQRTYNSAVQLFAMLCKEYGLNPLADGVIISHKEGCARGIATNHGDPEHLWSQLPTGYTMNGFRNDVKAAMSGVSSIGNSNSSQKSVCYQVQIDIANLNIRSEASVNSSSKGYIKPGIYEISAESDGAGATKWGKLKNGQGWVSLDYCKNLGSELDRAIEKLTKLGVINSPDYWKKNITTVKYLDTLFIKVANKVTGSGKRLSSPQAAIEQLVKDGIIDSPDYWMLHYPDCDNLDALLCAFGGAKKG